MERTRTSWTALAVTLLLPLAAACAGETGEEGQMMGEEGMAEEGQMAEEGMAEEAMTAGEMTMLGAMNESGVTGSVDISHSGESVTVAVEAEGLPGAGEYASHIHMGTCDSPGGVVVPLNSVMGVEGGTGTATSTVGMDQITGGDSYLVMVHGSEGAPIGCADLPSMSGGM